ncbi:hypothetical protein LCGC14_0396230 [marine sediment metagenome]|uniref:PD(D/E)XK endonuclease domain-containing protein n=1 Tax=marine sediment metagenome TaxID=412755 RepID=A0A0F9VK05_9ZZZZ
MGTQLNNAIGVAGELRVMSELLLRGHKPAKSYLEDGVDILLPNGLGIEVKSAHRCHLIVAEGRKPRSTYLFTLKGGGRKMPQNLQECDFLVLWCIDEDYFLIIPKADIKTTVVAVDKLTPLSKYAKYKNRWDLLQGEIK